MNKNDLSSFIHSIKEPIYSLDALMNFGKSISNTQELIRVFDISKENVNYLKRITENFSFIIKNDSNMYEINYSAMNIKEFLDLYCERITPYLNEKQIKLETEFSFEPKEFVTDFDVLGRILNDLVGNAVKYNNKEQKVIKITVKESADSVEFTVEDNGIGIPEEEIPMVTNLLYRASNGAKISTNGTGLGLKLVAGFVEQLNGELVIRSKVNVGTKISVTLPDGKITTLASGETIIKSLQKEALDLIFSEYISL